MSHDPVETAADTVQEPSECHSEAIAAGVARFLLVAFVLLLATPAVWLLRQASLRSAFVAFTAELPAAVPPAEQMVRSLPALARPAERLGQAIDEAARPTRLLPGWQRVLYALGTGNQTVAVGRGGWLAYRPAVDYVTGPPFLAPSALARRFGADSRPALLRFQRDLADRGIALWLLPVPSKVMVHPEGFAPELAGTTGLDNPSFADWRRDLESAGVRVFDPGPALRDVALAQPAFFRTDSHWRPAAIDAVAARLAAALEREVELEPRSLAWRTTSKTIPYPGDLVRLLFLHRSGLFHPETVEAQVVSGDDGETWTANPEAGVLLLGDSFSNIFAPDRAGFPARLAFRLARHVDAIILNGGGSWLTRHQLATELRERPDRLATTKVVILQFAVRELAVGEWRMVPLPPARPPRPAAAAPAQP